MSHDYCIIEVCNSFFFVLTSGRPLPVTTFCLFEATFAAQIVIQEFSALLQQRCLLLHHVIFIRTYFTSVEVYAHDLRTESPNI